MIISVGKWGNCPECGRRIFRKVVAGTAFACVRGAAVIQMPAPAEAAAQPRVPAFACVCGAAVIQMPAPGEAAAQPMPPASHAVRITKQQHARHSPEPADPKHVEAAEPPEFVSAPPFVGMQRPVRARLPRQPRGRIYTAPVPPPSPAPPPQPTRRDPVQARQLRQPRGRISGPGLGSQSGSLLPWIPVESRGA